MKDSLKALTTKLRENSVAADGVHFLDVSNYVIGPKELKSIGDAIKNNFQSIESGLAPLISIDLTGNQLCGVDLFSMTGNFDATSFNDFINTLVLMSKISRLKKINLSRNFLDVEGFASLGNLLSNGPSTISELYLDNCGANASCIQGLMAGLKSNKNLLVLDLRENDIGVEGARYIAEAMQSGPKLKQLILSSCNIEAEGASAIISSLFNNMNIEILNLSANNIGDQGATQIGLLLESNKYIKHLVIQENNITDAGMAAISKSLIKNRALVFLGVQWNFITNEGAEYLGSCMAQNAYLRAVHILGNAIDRQGIKAILEGSKMLNVKPVDVDMAGMNCCVVSAPPTPTRDKPVRRSRPTTASQRPGSASKK